MHRPALSSSVRRAAAMLAVGAIAAIAPAAAGAATVAVPASANVYWPGEGSQQIPNSVNGLTPGQNGEGDARGQVARR